MRKNVLIIITALFLSVLLSSCYTYSFSVGKGAKTGTTVKKVNKYFIGGLVKGKTSDPIMMASGASDYDVKITRTFGNFLLGCITLEIYTPTTTFVKK